MSHVNRVGFYRFTRNQKRFVGSKIGFLRTITGVIGPVVVV